MVHKVSAKEIAAAQRNMEIAKERGMPLNEILSHDLLISSPLFEGDLPTCVDKSKLVHEIESELDLTQWSPHKKFSTNVIVDFMSKIRSMHITDLGTLGEVVSTLIKSLTQICHPGRIHPSYF